MRSKISTKKIMLPKKHECSSKFAKYSSIKQVFCPVRGLPISREGRREPARALECSMGTGPVGGLVALPPKRFSVTTPFSRSENEGNGPVRTNFSKNCVNIPCKGYTKNCFMNQGHRFTLVKPSSHHVVALTRVARLHQQD